MAYHTQSFDIPIKETVWGPKLQGNLQTCTDPTVQVNLHFFFEGER
jgi:hypothetical protein